MKVLPHIPCHHPTKVRLAEAWNPIWLCSRNSRPPIILDYYIEHPRPNPRSLAIIRGIIQTTPTRDNNLRTLCVVLHCPIVSLLDPLLATQKVKIQGRADVHRLRMPLSAGHAQRRPLDGNNGPGCRYYITSGGNPQMSSSRRM
jgi:hypothetical protein